MKKWKNKIAAGVLTGILSISMLVTPVFAFVEGDINADGKTSTESKKKDKGLKNEALTPEGNASLVDDSKSSKKEFLTITTKNGNYFYLIIDRDANGEKTVHFLNQVDESDLLSLMDKDEIEEYQAMTNEKEKKETIEEETTEVIKETPEKKEKKNMDLKAIFILLAILLVGGMTGIYGYVKKKKTQEATNIDPDVDYDEKEENDFLGEEDYEHPQGDLDENEDAFFEENDSEYFEEED